MAAPKRRNYTAVGKPWVKGQSGNPAGGASRKGMTLLRPQDRAAWAKVHLPKANRVMLHVLGQADADPATRLRAAMALQDSAWGKQPQAIEGTVSGPPIAIAATATVDLASLPASVLRAAQARLARLASAKTTPPA